MDDEFDRMMVAVRVDRAAFGQEVAAMRAELEAALVPGALRAGRAIEGSLLAAVRGGKLGFEELQATALRALDGIAAGALRAGLGAVGGQGLPGLLSSLLGGLLGAPGRATGGPVVAGRAYTVGERGPELFVPASAGRIEPAGGSGSGVREVRVAITVNAPAGAAPAVMAKSGRQVARAVRAALEG